MLIQFKCENYRSIKEEVVFSMLATKDDTYAEKLLLFDKSIKINSVSAIYGANGSGKTNLIKAISYLNNLVSNSVNMQYQDLIPYFPHKLSLTGTPSSFEIQFIEEGVRYVYGVSLTEKAIIEEYLYYFPKGRQAKIFDRQPEGTTYGEKFKKLLLDIEENKVKENRLLLSTAASWCKLEEILNPFNYLRNKLVFYQGTHNNNWFDYTLENLEQNSTFKTHFIQLMREIGIDLIDVEVNSQWMQVLQEDLPRTMPDEIKKLLKDKQMKKSEVFIVYPTMKISLFEESLGVNKLFELIGPVIDILKDGEVLFFDELETSLHPNLVIHLVKLFLNSSTNPKGAQLIFTTHDTNLLDLSIFRRDQIWFVEKNGSYSSDYYSLANLKNVRKDENIEKGYIMGKYGAIPFINHNFHLK